MPRRCAAGRSGGQGPLAEGARIGRSVRSAGGAAGFAELAQGRPRLVALAGSKDLSAAQRLGLLLILARLRISSEAEAVLPGFLSDPDPRIRFAAIQWVGEHRLKEFRSTLQAGAGFDVRRREICSRPRWRRSRGSTARRVGLQDELAGEDYVAALLKDRANTRPGACSKRCECFGRTIRRSRSTACVAC